MPACLPACQMLSVGQALPCTISQCRSLLPGSRSPRRLCRQHLKHTLSPHPTPPPHLPPPHPLSGFRTQFQGYAVRFSPFEDGKLAVATSQNYGIIGNGRQYVLQVRSFCAAVRPAARAAGALRLQCVQQYVLQVCSSCRWSPAPPLLPVIHAKEQCCFPFAWQYVLQVCAPPAPAAPRPCRGALLLPLCLQAPCSARIILH